MKIGRTKEYHWVIFQDPCSGLADRLIRAHFGSYLHVTSFDSSYLRISIAEEKLGWCQRDDIAVSPLLRKGVEIPYDNYDEWYISESFLKFPDSFESFVSYGSFTPEDPVELTQFDDTTWERGGFDYLYPLQERFWNQINLIVPSTYVAMGDRDIVVSKNHELIYNLSSDA